MPGTLASFAPDINWLRELSSFFTPGDWPYMLSFTILTVLFSYFYVAIVFPTVDIAENLKKQGAFVPGVKPGARTAEYVDRVMSRISLPGAVFLAAIAIVPTAMERQFGVTSLNRVLGGTGLLICVGVALDTVQQMQQHLLLRRYDGFMKKGRVKFRGRQQRYI